MHIYVIFHHTTWRSTIWNCITPNKLQSEICFHESKFWWVIIWSSWKTKIPEGDDNHWRPHKLFWWRHDLFNWALIVSIRIRLINAFIITNGRKIPSIWDRVCYNEIIAMLHLIPWLITPKTVSFCCQDLKCVKLQDPAWGPQIFFHFNNHCGKIIEISISSPQFRLAKAKSASWTIDFIFY